jgi:hypothetical protein
LSDTLFIGPGFGWYSELGDGSSAFPILVINWSISDRLALTTGRGLGASQGPGLDLTYSLNNKWKLGLTGRYEQIRFALENDASSPRTYGEDRSLPLILSVRYSPWPMTMVGAFVGADFGGELSVLDTNGQRLSVSTVRIVSSTGNPLQHAPQFGRNPQLFSVIRLAFCRHLEFVSHTSHFCFVVLIGSSVLGSHRV